MPHNTKEENSDMMDSIARKAGIIPDDIIYDYRGKFMYGSECVAYVFESRIDANKFRAALEQEGYEANGDSLGKDFLVYSRDLTHSI
jgi:hypothetical protein